MRAIKEVVHRWRFNTFSGHFRLGPADWVHIKDPQGNRCILHKTQLVEMARVLKEVPNHDQEPS